MPVPYVPDGLTPQEYLRQLALEGMQRKVGHVTDAYRERLDYELGVVEQTGFAPYFLIVRDFAKFAHDKGIFFGVRGSAAGSLTSFSVDITEIDPVEYELTFERFLNPERIQMPDIDMDFEDARRSEVIEYVTNKYGADHVAQIVTFGTLAARAAIKDAGRALAMPLPQVNNVVGMIPTLPIGITIERALNEVPEMKAIYQREPEIRNLVDTAKRLEGISRHASVHAAGVVISHDPLVEYTPLQRSAEGGLVTQYGAAALETIGLLKMDFLGLINLSILGRAVANIEKSTGEKIDVGSLPLDDKAAYEVLGRGETTGVFQLESDGMRRYITQLRPTSVRELAAMIALYRPGPMAHIPTYIRAKHDPSKIKYPHKALKEVLEETYGVIVYQDQVMRIAQVISGYTLGQADLLRRAMGKKKKEVMAAERANFLQGASGKGIDEKSAGNIFDLIEPFAGYAFNKAHAVCYAMIAYQTAYLKANYPVDYMAALLASFIDKPDKMAICLEECRRLNVELLPPCVNRSDVDFQAENGAIRFGLAGIKNVGRAAVDVLLTARNEGGAFRSIDDLCNRLAANGQVSRSTVEALVQSGALAQIHPNRRALMELVESATTYAARTQQNRRAGQESLFGGDDTPAAEDSHALPVPNIPDFPQSELLKMEKDLLGVYLSGHPLQRYRNLITKHATTTVEGLQEKKDKDEVWLGGIISTVKPFRSKKSNEMMAYFTLEDLVGNSVPVTVFPSVYRDHGSSIDKDKVVIVHGRVQSRENVRDDDDGSSRVIELLADEVRILAAPREEAPEVAAEVAAEQATVSSLPTLTEYPSNGSNGTNGYGNGLSNGNGHAHREIEPPPVFSNLAVNGNGHTSQVAVHVKLDLGGTGVRAAYQDRGMEHAQQLLQQLRAALARYPGEAMVMLHANDGKQERLMRWQGRVAADQALVTDIESILGEETVAILENAP
jgi:DNA polymerase-3 subunit alpha